MSTFRCSANTLRLHRALLALTVVVCLSSRACGIGDQFLPRDTFGLRLAVAMIFGGIALLCSPVVVLLTWVSARLVRVEGVGVGRAYLVVVAEIILALLAMMCLPGFPEREAVRAAVTIAIAVIMSIALTKRVFRTSWKKAVATCLLSWAMVALLLVIVFLREVVQWLSWQVTSVR